MSLYTGVHVSGKGTKGHLEGCDVSGNRGAGVRIAVAEPLLTNNTIHGTRGVGVLLLNYDEGRLEGNKNNIYDNSEGDVINSSGGPVIAGAAGEGSLDTAADGEPMSAPVGVPHLGPDLELSLLKSATICGVHVEADASVVAFPGGIDAIDGLKAEVL